MGNVENAISDITKAIKISPVLAKDIAGEKSFDNIKRKDLFKTFVKSELPGLIGNK